MLLDRPLHSWQDFVGLSRPNQRAFELSPQSNELHLLVAVVLDLSQQLRLDEPVLCSFWLGFSSCLQLLGQGLEGEVELRQCFNLLRRKSLRLAELSD